MRVTQRTMYDGFINNMQSTLGAYMESNTQGASQKRINRPSDDPAGMALVLNTRRNIQRTDQHRVNVDTAQGWLNLTDSVLQEVSKTIISIKELTEQASTETYNAENRQQIASQLREMQKQLINVVNTRFEGKSLFAGHKYTESAYDAKLAVTSMDENLVDTPFTVSGDSNSTIKLIFGTDGTVGVDDINYRWSNDNGVTWNDGTLAAGTNNISMAGVTLSIPNNTTVKAEDPAQDISAKNGTVLYIRPGAIYNGDDQGVQPNGVIRGGQMGLAANVQGDFSNNVLFETLNNVDLAAPNATLNYRYSEDNGTTWVNGTVSVPNPATSQLRIDLPTGSVTLKAEDPNNTVVPANTAIDIQPRRADILGGPVGLSANVQGVYDHNLMVRIDSDVDLTAAGATMEYAYSTDFGNTWTKAVTQTPTPATGRNIRLPIPGGYMELASPQGMDNTLTAGTQVVVHPDRADLNFEIMQDTYVSANNVGKNIFGGTYNGKPALPEEENLFDLVGNIIAYCEFNNRDGVADCLAKLTTAQEKVLTEAARVGGLENRLILAKDILAVKKDDLRERLSYTEDVDLSELLTKMAQQELAYNTVLKSSSMIMQLNLAKFV